MENPFEEKQNKTSLGKFTLIYGGLTGVILIMISLIFYVIDVDPSSFLNYLNILLLIGAMAYAGIQYRNTVNDGFMSYGRALGCSFLVGLFASVALAIYTFVFFKYIDPGMITKIMATAEEQMLEKNPNLSDEEIEMALKYSYMFMSPFAMMIWTVLGMAFWSLIFALIVAAFTKKTDKSKIISEIR